MFDAAAILAATCVTMLPRRCLPRDDATLITPAMLIARRYTLDAFACDAAAAMILLFSPIFISPLPLTVFMICHVTLLCRFFAAVSCHAVEHYALALRSPAAISPCSP